MPTGRPKSEAGRRSGLLARLSCGYLSFTMDEMPPTTTSTRVAVECLTLWLERDRASAALHIAQLRQDPEEADELIVGLLNLSHKLLLKLAKDRGATPYDLEKKEREILSNLSLKLPESSTPGG
jgi:hypothetical protein